MTSLSHLPPEIRRAIAITPAAGTRERIVDITTTGRRTGRPRRIEIFFYRAHGATYLCSGAGAGPTGWNANLRANPAFTFHLRNGVKADLPAHATTVTAPAGRADIGDADDSNEVAVHPGRWLLQFDVDDAAEARHVRLVMSPL